MEPTVTDWISAVSAIAAAVFALVTAVVAIVAAVYAYRQWKVARDTLTTAREADIASNQPAVSVFIDVQEETPTVADLVIKNFGATGAHDIRTKFTPPLRRSSRGLTAPEHAEVLLPTIPFLAPGEEWRTYWDSGPNRGMEPDLPNRYEGHVYYRGLENSEHHNPVVLDFGPMKARVYGEPKRLKDVIKAIDALTSAVKARR